MSIEQVLQQWVGSEKGRKRIKAERSAKIKGGGSFGKTTSGEPVSRETALRYAEEMMAEVIDKLPLSLKESPNPITRDSFNDPIVHINGDSFRIEISFRPDAVHRESLAPEVEDYKDGIENIVVHLSNGWFARGAISGMWHGRETVSRRKFDGDFFMQEAVMSFNATHPYAEARLGDEYK